MRIVRFLLIVLLSAATCIAAADTIKMMQYNLMYYTDNAPEGCDEYSNSLNNSYNIHDHLNTQ